MRLFAEPLPARLEWDEGELVGLRIGSRRFLVVEVMRRWRIEGEWWRDGIARDYLTLRTADGLVCDIYTSRTGSPGGDSRTAAWLQRVMD